MSSQGVAKINNSKNYYSVSSHVRDKHKIYFSDEDYIYFLSLLNKFIKNNDSVDLVAYCLKPDHFDLLLFENRTYGKIIQYR